MACLQSTIGSDRIGRGGFLLPLNLLPAGIAVEERLRGFLVRSFVKLGLVCDTQFLVISYGHMLSLLFGWKIYFFFVA